MNNNILILYVTPKIQYICQQYPYWDYCQFLFIIYIQRNISCQMVTTSLTNLLHFYLIIAAFILMGSCLRTEQPCGLLKSKNPFEKVEATKNSCCPEGSWPALSVDYKVRGQILQISDTTVYHVGTSNKILIMFSDIYGIYTGRHFSVADSYADLGFNVYLPQILINPYNGQGSIADCIKSQDYAHMEKRFTDLLWYLNEKGYKQFYSNGFCWGAWIAFKFASKFNIFKAFAGCHPSLRTSEYFNQTQQDLVSSINCPAFLYPAGNDPDNIKQGGSLIKILADKFGSSKTGAISFLEQVHGWVIRGDISIPNVLRDVKKAIELSAQYLIKF